MSVLQTIQLSIGYKTGKSPVTLLENIHLSAEAGKLYMLLGSNGAGKSTLIKTLCGLLPPMAGEVLFNGTNLTHLSDEQRAQYCSVVLTHTEVPGLMTVHELVSLGRYPWIDWMARSSDEDNEKVARALEMTKMTSLSHRYFHELSDGQRQRAMIARALAQDTPLILLDEPTNHLDTKNRYDIASLILQLVKLHGKTVVMSTHDAAMASLLSDEIWLINDRNNFVSGITEDLVLTGALQDYLGTHDFTGFDTAMHFGGTAFAEVQVMGEEDLVLWTARALKKAGFALSLPPKGEKIDVYKEGRVVWFTCLGKKFDSISQLITALKAK